MVRLFIIHVCVCEGNLMESLPLNMSALIPGSGNSFSARGTISGSLSKSRSVYDWSVTPPDTHSVNKGL